MRPRRGPGAPVPLWEPPSTLVRFGGDDVPGDRERRLGEQARDRRSPRSVRWGARLWQGFAWYSVLVLVAIDLFALVSLVTHLF